MKKYSRGIFSVLGAAVLGIMAGCVSPCTDSAFGKYDDAKEIQIIDLKRTSQSWDGVELPDYPVGKPELVCYHLTGRVAHRAMTKEGKRRIERVAPL